MKFFDNKLCRQFTITIIFFAIVNLQAISQTQCLKSFEVSIGGASPDLAYDVADAGSGNFFVAGTTTSYGAGGTDVMVTKMSASGVPLWTKVYGAAGNETVRKANATPDGGLVITGQTTSFSYSQGEIFCMKIDAAGNLLWARHFGQNTEYGDLGLNIIQTTDGGFAVVGLYNIGGVVADLAIGRLDANGNVIWFKRLDSGQAEDGTGILQEGNELIVTTDLDNLGVNYSFLIMRLNLSDGSIINQIQYAPAQRGFFGPFLFKDINNNGYWLSGQTLDGYGYNGNTVPTIIRLDNNLNITNSYAYKAANVYTNDFFDGFVQMNGGFVVCASSTSTPRTGYLYNINNDASIKWGKMFKGPADRSVYRVGHIGTNVITVGADNSSGNDDFFIAGFNDGGFIDPLCNPDTALVSITAPSYNTVPFNWKINELVTFPNIAAPLTVSDANPTYKSLCNSCPVIPPGPSFTTPDTVCVNAPVKITNTSVGASSYYWSFCTADINQAPTGTNLGNIGGVLQTPVFSDIVTQNGNYYGFVTNYATGELVKLYFGSSMLNAPVVTDLGTFGGALPVGSTEGVQVVYSQQDQRWYAIIVGGSPIANTNPSIIKIDFGSSLDNPSPVATNWGNLGNLNFPHDLYMFQDSVATWHGITINKENNTVTRFDFNGGFSQPPATQNFGNLGNLNLPTGICAITENGKWYMFIINSYDQGTNPPDSGTITRLDFGSSLLNIPTAVNLGNPGNTLHNPRDIYIVKFCGEDVGFVVNHATNDIVKLDFTGNIASMPATVSFGNIGNLDFPHSLSKLFRVGADVYSLIPNAANSTITRIKFSGCTNASIPNSNLENPPSVSYSTPGIYNISLDIDDGLATQNSVCHQVVVVGTPVVGISGDTSICAGDSVKLTATGASTYQWSPTGTFSGSAGPNVTVKPGAATTYFVTGANSTGCAAKDSISVNVLPQPVVKSINDTSICTGQSVQLTSSAANGSTYSWSPSSGLSNPSILSPVATPLTSTKYVITVDSGMQCKASDTVNVSVTPLPVINTISDTVIILCKYSTVQLSTTVANTSVYSWSPSAGLSDSTALSPLASPLTDTKYVITAGLGKCTAKDSVSISVIPSPTVKAFGDTGICSGSAVKLTTTASPNVTYSWSPTAGLNDSTAANPSAEPMSSTVYVVQVQYSDNCAAKDSVTINVTPQPTINTIADTSICNGQSVTLATGSTNTNTFNWYPATGLANANIASPVASPSSSTTYVVIANAGTLCMATDTVNISVNPLPQIALSADTAICSGGRANILASSSNSISYSWSPSTGLDNPGIANPVASPLATTQYYVVATTALNCTAKDSVTVSVNPAPVFAVVPADASICAGDTITLSASGGDKYDWYPATSITDTASAAVVVNPQNSTTYYVAITNSLCHVADTLAVPIVASSTFSVSISKSNDVDCVEGQATLHATGGTQYNWFPITGISNPNAPDPVVSPLQTTTYYVMVGNGTACTGKDSITVIVSTADANNAYLVASAFTPNGDGVNDCFGVKFWGGVKSIDFSVYNRWGQRVFHSNNPSGCWDGTFNGQPEPTGTFVYQITASTICGNVYRKGTVVLIR